MKKVLALLLAVAMLTALLTACGGGDTQQSGDGTDQQTSDSADAQNPIEGVETIGGSVSGDSSTSSEKVENTSMQHAKITMDADRMSINPMGLWSSATEVYSMYEMLFQLSDGLGSVMVPVLADGDRGEFGGYDHEAGTGVYTFYIQPEIYDHAGNHLTASDVAFSFQKTLEYGQTSGWGVVQSWDAVDDTTVRMTCSNELGNKGELENIVLRCFMFTEAAYDASPSEFQSDACGTGPYKLSSYTEGASATLVKNEDGRSEASPAITIF